MIKERQILLKSGLKVWQSKSINNMTDQDCVDCVKYLWSEIGVAYIFNL